MIDDKTLLALIKHHIEKNDNAFKDEALKVADIFEENGKFELSLHIKAQFGKTRTFSSQIIN